MLLEFLTFIKDHFPNLSSQTTLLTMSGGVDSMVMAELFYTAGFPFSIAHCNFGLRGEESDGDELFVQQWANSRGVKAYFQRFETQRTADEQGISIQMAARTLRFDWFADLRQSQNYHYVATAHHANDAIETTLLNLSRGTGLAGLPGILPRQGYLIRPLLFLSKKQILDFADRENIQWREDSSNATDHYRRNLLRHHVVPILQQINPSLEHTFRTTSDRLRSANALLNRLLFLWKNEAMRQEGTTFYISIALIQEAQEPVFQLHYLLEPFGFNYVQAGRIVAALCGISGKIFSSPDYVLIKDRTDLILSPSRNGKIEGGIQLERETEKADIPGGLDVHLTRLSNISDSTPVSDGSKAYFDEKVVNFPLTIRPWQQGDWFCPFGMKGKRKKVSDFLIDQKVPLSQKKDQLVLVDSEMRIMWVLGFRTDERFRITENTNSILCISIIN